MLSFGFHRSPLLCALLRPCILCPVFGLCWYLWPFACFCTHLMFNISFGCCRHNVSNTFVQLTEGRSARDQPKQPPAKKKHYLVAAPLLSDLLIKYALLHPSQPPGPTRTQFTLPPVATWTKCRIAAPKIWAHQGAIKSADGTICTTTASLDAALRATRSFWQDFPTPISPRLVFLTNQLYATDYLTSFLLSTRI